jgi:hypothetical protein
MPRRSPPARGASPDVLRFHQALRSRNAAGATRKAGASRAPLQYDESGFPIPQRGGLKFAERVRRLLFTG